MFRRRVFYDAVGKVLSCNMAEGALQKNYTATDEANERGLTGWQCMEWNTPDADIEAAFAAVDADGNPRMVEVSVDVSGEPRLVFVYTPIEAQDDPYEMIDILTGVV